MNFTEALSLAQKGEPEAFDIVYGCVYRDLYRIAYYSLRTNDDIKKAVTEAVKTCMMHCGECKNQPGFRAYAVRMLCVQIVSCCQEYRKKGVPTKPVSDGLKQQFLRLTDAERLVTAIWAVCGYNPKQLAIVTGLDEAIAAEKLAAAQSKLENLVIVF